MIDVHDLFAGYGGVDIIREITFWAEKGELIGIIGPNGSGKSTLVKLMLKLLTPEKGEIKLFGTDIQRFDGWSRVGYVSQKASSFNGDFPATVNEIVGANLTARTGIFGKKPKDYHEKVHHALKKVGMQEYGSQLIGRL